MANPFVVILLHNKTSMVISDGPYLQKIKPSGYGNIWLLTKNEWF